ncbi:ROK family protein [Actinomycetaceae bacterium MB13-C1-2]|nr:ROK family protein [Actinomycetaceae bacterium MB13-C1-2]
MLLGIDIGGTKTSGSLVTDKGQLIGSPVKLPTPAAQGADAILGTAGRVARALLEATDEAVESVGVGAAGVIGPDGVVVSATDLLSGWTGTDIAGSLSASLVLPVRALNDVHAAAVGEAAVGAGRGCRRVLVVAVGTGIGGAFVRDGLLDVGPGNVAGSVGHLFVPRGDGRLCSCGVVGHAEAYGSGPSIESIYREWGGDLLDLRQIETRMLEGESLASRAVAQGAEALGQALAAAANMVDPDCIVIGGGVANMGEPYLDIVRRVYRSCALPSARSLPLIPAKLGVSAAIVGAALWSSQVG